MSDIFDGSAPVQGRQPPVLHEGSKIMFVGEAYGTEEERAGKPFVGKAGRLLWECAGQAGITRQTCDLTNVINMRPNNRNNITPYFNGRTGVFTDLAQPHLAALAEEINASTANIIVAVGGTALAALCARTGVTKWRGSILECTLVPGKKVIPIVHPSAALRPAAPGVFGGYLYRWVIIRDLKRVLEQSTTAEMILTRREYMTGASFDDYMEALQQLIDAEQPVAVDIEVMNQEVSMLGFAAHASHGICIPFTSMQGGHYFSLSEEVEVWKRVNVLLSHPGIIKVYQNALFDVSFLLQKHRMYNRGRIEDTMIMQHIAYPDLPKGLDFIASMYTDMPYYKYIMKRGKLQDLREGWVYNAKDAMVTIESWYALQKELKARGNEYTYERAIALLEPLLYFQLRGIKVNGNKLEELKKRTEEKRDKADEELQTLAGRPLNANSPKQLQQYFYIEKGEKPYIKRGKGTITTDNMAMKRLARKGYKEANLILDIRKAGKLIGTYCNILYDDDQRLRCSWNIAGSKDTSDKSTGRGTKTGRLSSSMNIFGKGMNMQNQTYDSKGFMVADEGCILVEIDKRQAEWVVVAYLAEDGHMMRIFEDGMDTHRATAALMFGTPYDDITHEQRQEGKRANHALNYDYGYKSFALRYEISEAEAKGIVERYHTIFPGIRANFHGRVRDQLSRNRTLTTCFGRKRLFLDRMGDKLYKQSYAHVPQSSVGELVNEAIIKSYAHNLNGVELLAQIHDSILYQMKDDEHTSTNICKLQSILAIPMEYNGREFTIKSDVKIGYNWRAMTELPKWDEADAHYDVVHKAYETAHEELQKNMHEDAQEWGR